MTKKNTKNKKDWKQYIGPVFFMLIGIVCGLLISIYSDSLFPKESSNMERLLRLSLLLIGMYITFFTQIIIHEAGHLVFGLLSGYRYSSFRIGSFIWIKDGKKINFKRLSIAGTGGQCLMSPPDMVDGKIPFVIYNLGGIFMNIVTAFIFLVLYVLCDDMSYLSVFFIMEIIVGFAFALLNGIPIRLGTVDNDGCNTLSLRKSNDAVQSFWVQMKMNEQISKGTRLKDMPKEWFHIPNENGMKNSMIASTAVFAANRLMDLHEFDEAKELMNKLFEMDSAISDLHHSLLVCDRVFCELISENCMEYMDKMLDKKQKAIMKQMKKFPSVIRTEYAYALLIENDVKKSEQFKEQFEKCAATYPYPCDIESERELIQIAEQIYTNT